MPAGLPFGPSADPSAALEAAIGHLRQSGVFDPDWYRATYADVALLGMDPAEHYLRLGILMGRAPGPQAPIVAPAARPVPALPPLAQDLVRDSLAAYPGPRDPVAAGVTTALPRVSVVVTAFNAAATIEACLRSLLCQTYPDLEIVICDDASTDATWQILQQMQGSFPDRLRTIRLNTNGGTYLAKNVAIGVATGSILLFQDADDHSHPERVMVQVLPLLADPGLVATRCAYLRFDPATRRVVPVADRLSRIGLITLAVRRAVFDEIGHFDAVRRAGDDEWVQRLMHLKGSARVVSLNVVLYLAELRMDSLIADMLSRRADGMLDQVSSPARKGYVTQFKARFADPGWTADRFRAAFPPCPLRPQASYPASVAALAPPGDRVVALLTCTPGDPEATRAAIARLRPQVDQLFLCLAPGQTPPACAARSDVTVLQDADWTSCLAHIETGGKACVIDCHDGFTYAHDHVRSLIDRLRRHDDRIVAGARGILPAGAGRVLHLGASGLHQPVLVPALVAGTLAFHSHAAPARLWSAAALPGRLQGEDVTLRRVEGVAQLCIDQPPGWLTGHAPPPHGTATAVLRGGPAEPAGTLLALQPMFPAELDLSANSVKTRKMEQ